MVTPDLGYLVGDALSWSFVVGWPSVYRRISQKRLESAAEDVVIKPLFGRLAMPLAAISRRDAERVPVERIDESLASSAGDPPGASPGREGVLRVIAVSEYHQDLNLLTAAALLLLMNLLRLPVFFWGNTVPLWYYLLVFAASGLVVLWLYLAHTKTNSEEYYEYHERHESGQGDKVPAIRIRSLKWGEVAGPTARWIFWSRVILISLSMTIGAFIFFQ